MSEFGNFKPSGKEAVPPDIALLFGGANFQWANFPRISEFATRCSYTFRLNSRFKITQKKCTKTKWEKFCLRIPPLLAKFKNCLTDVVIYNFSKSIIFRYQRCYKFTNGHCIISSVSSSRAEFSVLFFNSHRQNFRQISDIAYFI